MSGFVDLSHVVESGMTTYPGLPEPLIRGMGSFPVRAYAALSEED
jgi:kynurenine formamidase